ncbi:ferritin-like domain-containing protein [Flavobacterium sp.]|uniref:Dps family protein n=1 Tax=Flavobacterium sp. TaxID=239 RepID=UPI0033415C7A
MEHPWETLLKFEELYNDSQLKIDSIAERVLALGSTPLHTFEDYTSQSQLPIGRNVSSDEAAIALLLECLPQLLSRERKIIQLADAINNVCKTIMMIDFIVEKEKTIWMLSAWLEREI